MKAKLLTIFILLFSAALFANPQQDWGKKKHWEPERGQAGPYIQQRMQQQRKMHRFQPQAQQNWRRQAPQYRRYQQQRMPSPRAYQYRQPRQYFQGQQPAERFNKQRFFEAVKRRAVQNPEFRKKLRKKLMSKAWHADSSDEKCLKEEGKCPQDERWGKRSKKQQGRFEGKQGFRPRRYEPMQGQQFRGEKGFRKQKNFAPRQGGAERRMQTPMPYAGKDRARAMMKGKMMDRPVKFKCPHCGRMITKEMIMENRREAHNQGWNQKKNYGSDHQARKARKGEMKKDCDEADDHKMKAKRYRDKDDCDDKKWDDSDEKKKRQRGKHHKRN
ncbi:hypothetical protein [Sedimentisphaera salicampi]|uniref:hypothetical protein n=1 Tax=Sedimentisphaera salicampi TaxID=1941349 RepID=UPI000B9C1185|nr:hypothetical protein [Sedimentisphaera salicampi]OXU13960.1 hypothetical protein SMSP1_02121 [Sedimentisphaera salicampi]